MLQNPPSTSSLFFFWCRFSQPGCTAVQWEAQRTEKLLTANWTRLTFRVQLVLPSRKTILYIVTLYTCIFWRELHCIFWRGTFKPQQVIVFTRLESARAESRARVSWESPCCAAEPEEELKKCGRLSDNPGNERKDKQAHDSLFTHQTGGESQFIHLLENNISVISRAFFPPPNIPVLSSPLCSENMFLPHCASEWPSSGRRRGSGGGGRGGGGGGGMLQSLGSAQKNNTK